jgi:hypothetical protein
MIGKTGSLETSVSNHFMPLNNPEYVTINICSLKFLGKLKKIRGLAYLIRKLIWGTDIRLVTNPPYRYIFKKNTFKIFWTQNVMYGEICSGSSGGRVPMKGTD